MNKIMAVSASLLCVVMGGLICVENQAAIAAPPDIENPNIMRAAPPVALPDNSQTPQARLMNRDAILSRRVLPASARNVSLELTTMGRYLASPEGGGGDLQAVSQGRQVWVLKDQYAEYEHIRLGLLRDAVVTNIIDAETGNAIGTSISSGTPIGPVGLPNITTGTPVRGFPD
jgi:hypothetical protein